MRKVELGRTGITVGEVALGAEHLGGRSPKDLRAILSEAIAGGMNLVDLIFEDAAARDTVCPVIAERRNELVLAGHLGQTFPGGQYSRTRDVGRCEAAFATLLTLLRTDRVDILHLHWVDQPEDFDAAFDPEGFLALARRIRDSGRARCIGISTHSASVAHRAVESGEVEVVMFPVNAAHDLLPADVGLPAMWEHDSWPDESEPSGPHSARMARYASASAAERDFSGIDMSPLWRLQGQCTYCNHCLPCPAGIPIGELLRIVDLGSRHGADSVAAAYRRLGVTASACIRCGVCEERCPFGVSVIEAMDDAVAVYGV